mmetsp:Transcript_19070/g.25815  ORF Transcript_19070/g.25815 Transcript_19070/m.25815 type:complete len:332 (+) Transcript_19070:91-1086(+)
MNVFVIVKALVITYFCGQGIMWFFNRKYNSYPVIFTLLISIGIVLSEMAYRFTDRNLRYRFFQNAFSQWQVWLCMTVMLGFARKNDAAHHKFPMRAIFIPIHVLYATVLVLGIANEDLGTCTEYTYPRIFAYQYCLFFVTYALCLFLYKKDFFLEWHESIKNVDLKDELQHSKLDDEDAKRRLRVRMLLNRQGSRFVKFHTFLLVLTVLALTIIVWQMNKYDGEAVTCAASGNHWRFRSCGIRFIVNFLHVFTTMQCGAMARVVFVKSVKQVEQLQSYSRITTMAINENDEAANSGFNRVRSTGSRNSLDTEEGLLSLNSATQNEAADDSF